MVLQTLDYLRIALSRLSSGVGILPAIESTLGNRKLEAYATLILKLELDYCPSRRISALLRTICA